MAFMAPPWRGRIYALRPASTKAPDRCAMLDRPEEASMDFDYSPKVQQMRSRVDGFMQEFVFPHEHRFHDEIEENTRNGRRWTPTRVVEELKVKARAAGLWNLFLPDSAHG